MTPRLSAELMALRVAREILPGEVVNLGYGLPGLVADYLQDREDVWVQTENGVIGLGRVLDDGEPYDPEIVNAMGQPSTVRRGAAFVDSVAAFGLIRGGHVTTAVLGGLQVSCEGDLANWMVPARGYGGVGGAMDLCTGVGRVIVVMQHADRDGRPKIVERCTFPLTGQRCVRTVVTDVAVVDVTAEGLVLREVAPGWTPEAVQAITGAPLDISRAGELEL
ncbi:MAG: 3-oxoacid CoA-transferase subunit B [Dehalococcoidia bacterium]